MSDYMPYTDPNYDVTNDSAFKPIDLETPDENRAMFRTDKAESLVEYDKLRVFYETVVKHTGKKLYRCLIPHYATLSTYSYEAMRDKVVNNEFISRDLTRATVVNLSLFNILEHIKNGVPVKIYKNERTSLLSSVMSAIQSNGIGKINVAVMDSETEGILNELLNRLNAMTTVAALRGNNIFGSYNDTIGR